MGNRGWRLAVLGGALSSMAAVAIACGGGGASEADLTAAQNLAKEKEAQLAAAQSQLAAKDGALQVVQKQLAGMAPSTIVQAGQLQPAPAGAQPAGWDTAESIRSGVKLFAKYDSSGPDAWDQKAHPLVFITSEGPGYGHRPSKTAKFPGLQIIDANTKQIVTSVQFDLGFKAHGTPHGLGISPDGKWLYVATGDGAHAMTSNVGTARLLIVNARTLKLDTVLTTEKSGGTVGAFTLSGFHHMKAFKDWQGRNRVLVEDQSTTRWILDPNDNHRVVRAVTLDQVGPMGHPYSTVDPTGKFLYLSMSNRQISEGEFPAASIAKVNLETGAITIIPEVGKWPIGMAHTADGKYTYVADGSESLVYKIDNATNKVVAHASAGVAGPYGLALNWDETELWTVGKGEGSHNTGGVLGLIDTKIFRPSQIVDQPVNIGGSIVDHAILNPDPNANELWVTSAGTWETIVVDLKTKKVKARIPSPNGGDTHSGGFVRYNPDWTGEVLSDQGGPQKGMYAIKMGLAAKVAAIR